MSDSSPGPGVTPSMVVIAEPVACVANIRQERTAAPSNSTVQAPQTPCSQPAWAPLRSSKSRRQSSSVVRGSTSSACKAPLTLSSMRIRVPLSFRPQRRSASIGNRADGETDGGAATVVGQGVQVGQGLDTGERAAHCRVNSLGIEGRTPQLLFRRLEAHRKIGGRADADGDALAFSAGVQLDLSRRGDESEIAAPRAHFVKADADFFAAPDREVNAG